MRGPRHRRSGKSALARLRSDLEFRAQVATAADHHVPLSILLGRPWPEPGEPLWLDEDRAVAVAWHTYKAMACPGCGTFSDDWVDPISAKTVDDPPFVGEARICWGCAERQGVLRETQKNRNDMDGVYVVLRPYDPDADDVEDGAPHPE